MRRISWAAILTIALMIGTAVYVQRHWWPAGVSVGVWLLWRVLLHCLRRGARFAHRELSRIDRMEGVAFERYVVGMLRKNGFRHVQQTKATGDFGADILAQRHGESIAIQCKCYARNIGNKAVENALAGRQYYHCDHGAVITNQYFTRSAVALAGEADIELWDRDRLLEMIKTAYRIRSSVELGEADEDVFGIGVPPNVRERSD